MKWYDLEDMIDRNLEKYWLWSAEIKDFKDFADVKILDDNNKIFWVYKFDKIINPKDTVAHWTKKDIIDLIKKIVTDKINKETPLIKVPDNQLWFNFKT
jgi:hypothetical protein